MRETMCQHHFIAFDNSVICSFYEEYVFFFVRSAWYNPSTNCLIQSGMIASPKFACLKSVTFWFTGLAAVSRISKTLEMDAFHLNLFHVIKLLKWDKMILWQIFRISFNLWWFIVNWSSGCRRYLEIIKSIADE